MNLTKLSHAVLVLSFGLCFNAHSQAILTNGLVAYYPFDGNATDSSGHGNDATVVSATPGPDRVGNLDAAYYFDGATSHISLPQSLVQQLSGTGPVSVSAWVQTTPDTASQFRDIVAFGATQGGQAFILLNVSGALSFSQWGNSELSTAYTADGNWHQCCAVYVGSSLALYVDGVQRTNFTVLSNRGASLGLIGEGLGGGEFWKGAIDDVRIYTVALSTTDVQQLYQYESGLPCTPHDAVATATVVNGFVVGATIVNGGCGYTNPPLVVIQGGGGSGATATAVVTNGIVVKLQITNAGTGYTSTPTIQFFPQVGLQMELVKAVKPVFLGLQPGTNYQLQVSVDLSSWTNQGQVFTATNPINSYPQYFQVQDWNQLFFRLLAAP